MCRLCGAFLLILAAVALGLAMRSQSRRSVRALSDALQGLREIRRRIELFNTPVTELFSDTLSGGAAVFSPERAEELCTVMGEDGEIFRACLTRLGYGYREETLRLCDYTISSLEQSLAGREAELPARVKLYTAMPVFFALSLIVLLW